MTKLVKFAQLCLLLGFSSFLTANETIRLVTIANPSLEVAPPMRALLTELFARAKVPYTLEHRPVPRAELEFKNGLFDGDVARAAPFAARYPAAIRVEPPVFHVEAYAFSKRLHITQWHDLKPYRVAYLRGTPIIEQMLDSSKLEPVTQYSSCLAMVNADRVDVCLINIRLIQENELIEQTQNLQAQHFTDLPIYMFLAPRHQPLALKLGHALTAMQKDGSLARFQHEITHSNFKPAPKADNKPAH